MFLLVFECQLTCCMRAFFFSTGSAVFVRLGLFKECVHACVSVFSKCSRMSRFTISGSTQKFGAITGDGHIRGLSNQHTLSQPKKTPRTRDLGLDSVNLIKPEVDCRMWFSFPLVFLRFRGKIGHFFLPASGCNRLQERCCFGLIYQTETAGSFEFRRRKNTQQNKREQRCFHLRCVSLS